MDQPAVWAPLGAFLTALIAVWWLTHSSAGRLALDYPNARSLHQVPRPRTGGIGIHAAIALCASLAAVSHFVWISFSLLLLVSFIDDIRGVPVSMRLAVHVAAAGLLAGGLLLENEGFFVVVVAALAIAWMANLYNFMDGADGLAAGMTVAGFSFYGVAAWQHGSQEFALLNLSIAAAAGAFLVFNFFPARIFMGDVGSVPLGFLAGALGLIGWQQDNWTLWFPILVFSPFVIDSSVTLARRLLRGERVWQAHREHYYQRLVQMGWGHRRTALAEYAVMLASGSLGLAALSTSTLGRVIALFIAVAAYAVIILWIEHAWRRRAAGAHSDA